MYCARRSRRHPARRGHPRRSTATCVAEGARATGVSKQGQQRQLCLGRGGALDVGAFQLQLRGRPAQQIGVEREKRVQRAPLPRCCQRRVRLIKKMRRRCERTRGAAPGHPQRLRPAQASARSERMHGCASRKLLASADARRPAHLRAYSYAIVGAQARSGCSGWLNSLHARACWSVTALPVAKSDTSTTCPAAGRADAPAPGRFPRKMSPCGSTARTTAPAQDATA